MAKRKNPKLIRTSEGNKLEVVNPNAAGIDIADTEMQVCVPNDGRCSENNRRFGSFTKDLHAIVNWLKECNITTVAMEATGIYYIPLFLMLLDEGIDVLIANAREVKNIAGHKTDYADAEWLMSLHRLGLIKSSYQPGNQAREIRNVARHRNSLLDMCRMYIQHMQKAMEQMNIKLSVVLSDITGKTGRAIINAILDGERDPEVLAGLADPRCKATRETIAAALEGTWRDDLLFTLKQSVAAYDFAQQQLAECDDELERLLEAYKAKIVEYDPYMLERNFSKKKEPRMLRR